MLDRTDPEGAIAEAAAKFSNWGRWGEDDVLAPSTSSTRPSGAKPPR